MAGRWSVWNDPAVQALATRCVPAADEVWRLQRSQDPEAQFFQAIADGAHYRRQGGTRQGIYLITPAGRLLASVNSLDAEVVRDMLEEGLAVWDAMDPAQRHPVGDARFTARSRWEDHYPANGLVLRVTLRDLPEQAGDGRVPRYNLDHVWVGADEIRAALPESLAPGDTFQWPALAERLARFHLVDSALGQTLPYAPEEIRQANLTLSVRSIEDGIARLDLSAGTTVDADGVWRLGENDWKPDREWPRSMTVKLLGTARLELAQSRFRAFELVGVGDWTGKTRFNGRKDRTAGRLGFVFELAEDTPRERVAPAFIDVYERPLTARLRPDGSGR